MLCYSVRRFRSNPRAVVHKAARGAAKVPASDKAYFITVIVSFILPKMLELFYNSPMHIIVYKLFLHLRKTLAFE